MREGDHPKGGGGGTLSALTGSDRAAHEAPVRSDHVRPPPCLCPARPRRPCRRPHQGRRRLPLRRRLSPGARRSVARRARGGRALSRPLPRDRRRAAWPRWPDRVSPYDSDKAFDRVRDGADDLSFLDGSEIVEQNLAGRTTPGPTVVFVSTAAMVPSASAVKSLADLAGKSVCFYQGSNAHRNLEAWMAAHRLDFLRMGYMGICRALRRLRCRHVRGSGRRDRRPRRRVAFG